MERGGRAREGRKERGELDEKLSSTSPSPFLESPTPTAYHEAQKLAERKLSNPIPYWTRQSRHRPPNPSATELTTFPLPPPSLPPSPSLALSDRSDPALLITHNPNQRILFSLTLSSSTSNASHSSSHPL